MSERESQFNPEYDFLEDEEIRTLQSLLDQYVTTGSPEARQGFPGELQRVADSCASNLEKVRLLMRFLQKNIRLNYAGGIGKDINNPVVSAISKINRRLAKTYPDIFKSLE